MKWFWLTENGGMWSLVLWCNTQSICMTEWGRWQISRAFVLCHEVRMSSINRTFKPRDKIKSKWMCWQLLCQSLYMNIRMFLFKVKCESDCLSRITEMFKLIHFTYNYLPTKAECFFLISRNKQDGSNNCVELVDHLENVKLIIFPICPFIKWKKICVLFVDN